MRCSLAAKDLMEAARAAIKWLGMHRRDRQTIVAVVAGSIEETVLPEGATALDAGSQDTSHHDVDLMYKETTQGPKDKANR